MLAGMYGMVISGDIFNMYVFLEIASTEYGFSSFDYIVEICGIDPGPVATEARSWSAVKAAYR